MRFLTLATGFFVCAATVAQAMPCLNGSCLQGAPAPAIGAGAPVALAAGALLCARMLVKLWRRSKPVSD
jgi:hypothetical protein